MERENKRVLESGCERSTVFDPSLACVSKALLCVTTVLACEIPHTQYLVDPRTTLTLHVSDPAPKCVISKKPGGGQEGGGGDGYHWCTNTSV